MNLRPPKYVSPEVIALVVTLAVPAALATKPGAARPPPPSAVCVSLPAGKPRFLAGETLDYELDLLGVRLGTMSLETAPAPSEGKGGLVLRARAQADSLAQNFRRFKGRATVSVGADLSPRHYAEEAVEETLRRAMRVEFPPQVGRLTMDVERDGVASRLSLPVDPGVRDYLSVVYYLRTLDLPVGKSFCLQAVASRSVWRVSGQVLARELVKTPAGDWNGLHLALEAVRVGDPETKREVHAWLSDDQARIPLGAFGTVRGKPVRALLTRATGVMGAAGK